MVFLPCVVDSDSPVSPRVTRSLPSEFRGLGLRFVSFLPFVKEDGKIELLIKVGVYNHFSRLNA